jgi:HlyD family secretion protein
MPWLRRGILIVLAVLVVGALVYALLPKPVAVDLATIDRGAMEVTVDEEGVARIRDVYQVSAPISGQVDRSPLKVGDVVRQGSIIAEIRAAEPSLLDVRSRSELQAAADAAAAAVRLAEAELSRAEVQSRLAEADLVRVERLAESGTVSLRRAEEAQTEAESARATVRQAEANLLLRQSEKESAEARLIEPETDLKETAQCCVEVHSPVDGVVLKILAESAQVIAAGTPIAEIGDPGDMEVRVDLLSADAVRVVPGASARVEEWGGGISLAARVRRIEPAAFTKVSALGIEEQRVNVLLDLIDPPDLWSRLGHEFRVYARITVWRGEDVVRVPLAALFRSGPEWAVFRVSEGRAVLTAITIDHRDASEAEVTSGLSPGDVVVLHPSDEIADGTRIEARDTD